jgi:hypothetical protein
MARRDGTRRLRGTWIAMSWPRPCCWHGLWRARRPTGLAVLRRPAVVVDVAQRARAGGLWRSGGCRPVRRCAAALTATRCETTSRRCAPPRRRPWSASRTRSCSPRSLRTAVASERDSHGARRGAARHHGARGGCARGHRAGRSDQRNQRPRRPAAPRPRLRAAFTPQLHGHAALLRGHRHCPATTRPRSARVSSTELQAFIWPRQVGGVEGVVLAPNGEASGGHHAGPAVQSARRVLHRRVGGERGAERPRGPSARVSIILASYPGRDMRAMLSGSARVPNSSGPDAVRRAVQGAMCRVRCGALPQAMEASGARASR